MTKEVDAGQRDGPDAFVMPLDGSGPLPVSWREVPHFRQASLSPDGTKEAIVVLREKGDPENLARLYVRDANEDEYFIARSTGKYPGIPLLSLPRNATVSDATWATKPTWAPDSMRMAFTSLTHPQLIWTVDIDGSNLVELTNGLGGGSPAWQPVSLSATATSVEFESWGRIKSLLSH